MAGAASEPEMSCCSNVTIRHLILYFFAPNMRHYQKRNIFLTHYQSKWSHNKAVFIHLPTRTQYRHNVETYHTDRKKNCLLFMVLAFWYAMDIRESSSPFPLNTKWRNKIYTSFCFWTKDCKWVKTKLMTNKISLCLSWTLDKKVWDKTRRKKKSHDRIKRERNWQRGRKGKKSGMNKNK